MDQNKSELLDEVGGNPEMFLEYGDILPVSTHKTYEQLLEECATRFTHYNKYLNKKSDYYSERGMTKWLIGQRKQRAKHLEIY